MRKIIYYLCVLASLNMSAQCIEKVWSGEQHFIAISQDGTLWAWGYNYYGQIGNGNTTYQNTPVQASLDTDWLTASAGRKHNLAIKTNGTLWAWGSDEGEALGNGTSGQYLVPTQTGTDTDWKEVSAGETASLAVKTDGTLWTWGTNTYGALGNGSGAGAVLNEPTQVGTANDWQAVSGSGQFVLAIKENGTLWAWGSNDYGQLGIGNTTPQTTPVQVGTATDWKWIDTAMSSGAPISIAMKTDNSIWLWGHDTVLQIEANIPVQFGTETDWKTISVRKDYSNRYAMFTKQNGTLWAWGSDNSGQLGNDENSHYTVPTQIGSDTDWVSATAGYQQANGTKTDGSFWAWGSTYLVNNGTSNTQVPTQHSCTSLLGLDDFVAQNALQVYPNPVTDIVNFSHEIDAEVFDMTGKNITTVNASTSLNVSSFAKGIYVIVTSEGVTKKIVVQ